MLKKLLCFIVICLLLFTAACSNKGEKSKWNYSKEECAGFLSGGGILSTTDDPNVLNLFESSSKIIFNKELKEEDIKLINATEMMKQFKSEDDIDYISYEYFKDYCVKIIEIVTDSNMQTINIKFEGSIDDSYLVLIHKDAAKEGNFILLEPMQSPFTGYAKTDMQTKFEEEFLEDAEASWEDAKNIINIIGGFTQVILACEGNQPIAIAGGIFSIITSAGNLFAGRHSPSIGDVLAQLNVMDKKLDDVLAKMDANQQELLNQINVVNAKVDQVLLNQMEADRTAFYTDYIKPLEDFKNNFNDLVAQMLKTFVNEGKVIEVYYTADSEGKLSLTSYKENLANATKFTVTVREFSNAKAFLAENKNVVKEGFMDALVNDILNSIATSNEAKPIGRSEDDYANDIMMAITEKLTMKYYEDNHDKALELLNNTIGYANRIAGVGARSIISSYYNRAKLMFNFAGEAHDTIVDMLSSMLYELERISALASAAAMYAEINDESLIAAYANAKTAILNLYEEESKLPISYCYETSSVLEGYFLQCKWGVGYTNPGNHPKFTAELIVQNVYKDNNYYQSFYVKDDINNHQSYISDSDHLRIMTRMNILKSMGLVDADKDYIRYLSDNGAINKSAIEAYDDLVSRKWIGSDCYRIGYGFQMGDMAKQQKYEGLSCTCTACGNPDGEYFTLNKKYSFMKDHDPDCWAGKILTGTIIDKDGNISSNQKLGFYATYHESHSLWFDDEYWAFQDNPVGNYFFCIQNKVSE